MKILPQHFEYIRDAIEKSGYNNRKTLLLYINSGRKEKQFRWDMFHSVGLTPWVCANLYSYLSDTQIDTALKSIVVKL